MRTFCGALVEFERQEVAINLVTALFLVIGVLAVLRIGGGGKLASPELVTGSIQRSPAVRRSASDDPMSAFLVMPSLVST